MSNKQLQARALTEHDAEIMKNILVISQNLIETNYENKMKNEKKVKEIEVKIKEKEGQKEGNK